MPDKGNVDVSPYTECRSSSHLKFAVFAFAVAAMCWTWIAALPAMAQSATVTVTVEGGSGSGTYMPGEMITIGADAGPPGQTFIRWTGDVVALTNQYAPNTILTVPSADATVSALYGVVTGTGAVTFTSHENGDVVDEKGFTVFGIAQAEAGITAISASVQIEDQGPVPGLTDVPLAVGPLTGQFAIRVFDEDVPPDSTVLVTVEAQNSASETTISTLRLSAGSASHEMHQLFARTSFGATPEMIEEYQKLGYEKYVDDQIKAAKKMPKKVNTDEDFIKKVKSQKFWSKFRDNESEKIRQLMRERISYLLWSENQLCEMLGLFWDNHFSTTAVSNDDFYGELMEMRAFRDNCLGYFRDLLEISAKSTVMMNYLNNNRSSVGNINENYAREVMELHTVGVDAGYTAQDIIEVARVFTGWSESRTAKTQKMRMKDKKKPKHDEREFIFEGEDHDGEFKFVPFLGTTIQGSGTFDMETGEFPVRDGMEEGEEVLDMLALNPNTAQFICWKLVQYFVNDVPPTSLVDSCAVDYTKSKGHIGTIVKTILMSDEFRNDPANFRSKLKTPTEYIVSLIRNFGFRPPEDRKKKEEIVRQLDRIRSSLGSAGMSWFRYPTPDGFPEEAEEWASSVSLLERFQYGIRAPMGNYEKIAEMGLETPEAIAAGLMDLAMGGRYSRAEYDAVVSELYGNDGFFDITSDNGEEGAIYRALQLIAVSPSFQVH